MNEWYDYDYAFDDFLTKALDEGTSARESRDLMMAAKLAAEMEAERNESRERMETEKQNRKITKKDILQFVPAVLSVGATVFAAVSTYKANKERCETDRYSRELESTARMRLAELAFKKQEEDIIEDKPIKAVNDIMK